MYSSSFHIGKKIDSFSNVGTRPSRCEALTGAGQRRRRVAADALDGAARRVLGRGDAAATVTRR